VALEPDTVIQDSLDHEERAVRALEDIAEALVSWCKLEQQRFERDFPPRRNPLDVRDATITHIPTAEEQLKAAQGQSEEPTEEWIGLREQELLDQRSKESASVSRNSEKRVPAKKTQRKS